MKPFLSTLAGAALAAATTMLTGMLAIQVVGLQDGLRFSLLNVPIEAQTQRLGVVPIVASVAVLGVALFLLTIVCARFSVAIRTAFRVGFALVASGLVVAAMVLVSGSLATPPAWDSVIRFDGPFVGWIQEGGVSVGLHLVIVSSIAAVAIDLRRRRLSRRGGSGAEARIDS